MMNPPRAFDDEQLNADFAIILGLRDDAQPPLIESRLDRRRSAFTKVLRSPQASVTIGAAFVLAMLGTTAFLLLPSQTERAIEKTPPATAPPPVLASRDALADRVPAANVDAEPDNASAIAAPSSRPSVGARNGSKRASLRLRSRPDTWRAGTSLASAATDGEVIDPVALQNARKPEAVQATNLAQNAVPLALPRVRPAALEVPDVSPAPIIAGEDDRLARARRESVAALRALRRQW